MSETLSGDHDPGKPVRPHSRRPGHGNDSAQTFLKDEETEFQEFVERYGRPFTETLGIDLKSRRNEEVVKWFLASILYSKPIRESTATLTYRIFAEEGILSPSRILRTGWEGLVALLDEGGYTRYDFSTAEKLLRVFGALQERYEGDLNRLHELASDSRDLENRITGLGKGIGPTTVSIFLREMRSIWYKAHPAPTPLVELAMSRLGITDIEKVAKELHLDPVKVETALLRLGRGLLKSGKPSEISLDATARSSGYARRFDRRYARDMR